MPTRSVYLVRKRILDSEGLWGTVLQYRGKLLKCSIQDMLTIISYKKQTILVDMPGQDKPVPLALVNERHEDGLHFYFRTVHDDVIENNFSQVPAIKLVSANKLRILKP